MPDELQSARSVLTPRAAPSAPRTARDWWMVVSVIWITGTVLLLFRLVLGFCSEHSGIPKTWGVFYPKVPQ